MILVNIIIWLKGRQSIPWGLYTSSSPLTFSYPNILESMSQILDTFNSTAVPPSNQALDPFGLPELWNHVWTDFGDYENQNPSAS